MKIQVNGDQVRVIIRPTDIELYRLADNEEDGGNIDDVALIVTDEHGHWSFVYLNARQAEWLTSISLPSRGNTAKLPSL